MKEVKKEAKSHDKISIEKSRNRVNTGSMGKSTRSPTVISVKKEVEPRNSYQQPTRKSTKVREIKIEETDCKIQLDLLNSTDPIDSEMSDHQDESDPDSEYEDPGNTENSQKMEPDVDEAELYCSACERTFSCKRDYKNHMWHLHRTLLPESKKSIIIHPDVVPDTSYPNIYCGACERTYDTREAFRKHLYRTHHISVQNPPDSVTTAPAEPSTSEKKVIINPQDLPDTSKGNLHCGPCNKTFNLRCSYRSHLYRTHNMTSMPKLTTNGPTFQCGMCDKTYGVKDSYRKHLRRIHNTYVSATPNSTVPSPPPSKKKNISTQALPDTSIGNLYCGPCDKTFNFRVSYRRHLNNIHNIFIRPPTVNKCSPISKSSFQCMLCEKKYDVRESYRKHLKRTHGILLKSLAPKEAVAVDPQVLPDTSVGNLHCAPCNKTFNLRCSYRWHLKHTHNMSIPRSKGIVIDDSSYYCDACEKTFNKRDTYRKHLNLIHKISILSVKAHNPPPSEEEVTVEAQALPDTSPGNLYCGPCNKTFNLRSSYRWHLNNTHNIFIRPPKSIVKSSYYCDTCKKTFNKRYNYRKHLNHVHNTSIVSLNAHNPPPLIKRVVTQVLPDTSVRNLHCGPCNKTFNLRDSYRWHLKHTHNMSIPRPTPTLAKILYLPSSTSERHCKSCEKTFANGYNFRRHLQRDVHIVKSAQ